MHWESLLGKEKAWRIFGRPTMRIIIFLLTLSVFSCSGFPVYDYDLPVTEEALNASIARINSQSWSRNLYGVVRSRVMGVDTWDSDTYGLDLRFSIRETVCAKASGRDPSTCDFKSGPFVMMHVPIRTPDRRGSAPREDDAFAPEAFPSRGRGSSRGDWNKPSYFNPDRME
ncbi:secreted phosphoprotein 24 isoform X2 [Zonotrichia albicollis]|uniref:secreted phosphoprotein 24 isoform X2 n=1 Tax=Zonotrichia albicollis TaxID=44394 RepID=UPI003D80BA6B